jgi:hypothetical protein
MLKFRRKVDSTFKLKRNVIHNLSQRASITDSNIVFAVRRRLGHTISNYVRRKTMDDLYDKAVVCIWNVVVDYIKNNEKV